MPLHPHKARHQELMSDVLVCLSQFDYVSARQIAFWLYGQTNDSALNATHRLIRTLLDLKLVLRRRAGDGIHRLILTRQGANKLGIRPGYDLSLLNARHHDETVRFLTVMHLQGFNVFGRGRIRREAPKFRDADGLVLDTLDAGYAVVLIRSNSIATVARIERLQKLIEVRGLGYQALLNQLHIHPAKTFE